MAIELIRDVARKAADIALETLWPTRCAVCDLAGESVICTKCEDALFPIDLCLACPICGAPYGRIQCTECNEVMLNGAGISSIPMEKMSHALVLDEAARRIVSIYKDSDERRLCGFIAERMSRYVDPEIIRRGYAIAFIPDSKEALKRRGFDHSEEIATELSRIVGLECARLFERPRSADQRKLGRNERMENMRGSLQVKRDIPMPESVLVVDDVCTTGATIYAACKALRDAGVKSVCALTFAQVME